MENVYLLLERPQIISGFNLKAEGSSFAFLAAMFKTYLLMSEVGFRIMEEQFLFILESIYLERLVYFVGNQ